jgi:hypothetical protein
LLSAVIEQLAGKKGQINLFFFLIAVVVIELHLLTAER